MYKGESANHLFHFTSEYNHLLSILTEKFKPFFCIEDISFMYEDKRNLIIALPMVCFCDIPLERHTEHMKNYGEYGIGLKKEWGIRKNLSIVNYTNKESAKASGMRLITTLYPKICQSNINQDELETFRNAYSLLLMSSKPYEGFRIDKNANQDQCKKYRFYDEREWRYIPLADKLKWSISLSELNNDTAKFIETIKYEEARYHKDSRLRLEFNIDDIDYIFLKNHDTEVSRLRDDLLIHFTEEKTNSILSKVVSKCNLPVIPDLTSITLTEAKEGFLTTFNPQRNIDTAASAAIKSAVQRANVYSPNLTYNDKKKIREYWAKLLSTFAERYTTKRSLEHFKCDIVELKCKMNNHFPTSFCNKKLSPETGLRIAQAQKSLSVYLKHLWCMDKIPTPPACPIDREILAYIKADYIDRKWTHIDSIEEYEKQLELIFRYLNPGELIAEWEIKVFCGINNSKKSSK